MKDSFKRSMDWLHTWAGLIFGWLLFAIFFTGTLTVFDKEITHWMQPEVHHIQPSHPNIEAATQQLARLGPDAERWWIEFPNARTPHVRIFWQNKGKFEERQLDPVTGDLLLARKTQGGDFFYRFHYQLHLNRPGVWIVGAAAMVMLVALVTGLVIHQRIFKDFFTFRPWASSHRAWLDAHNVTSVLVLPFHFIITFTGLVIFWTIYMPAGLHVLYGGDQAVFRAESEVYTEREKAHQPAPLVSLSELERQARAHWNGGATEAIDVKHPGDRQATVEITRRADDRLALIFDRVTFDGTTGKVLQVWKGDQPAFLTYSVLIGLHYIWFDNMAIRWLYFIMGLAASAMIATGLELWTIKRRERHASDSAPVVGYRLVEGLNVAAVAGLVIATAVFFWANRLLPVELAERAQWEMRCFFLAWALCLVHGLLRRASWSAWKEQLYVAALLLGFLPVLNAFATESHLLVTLAHWNWSLAGIDLTALCTGVLLGWTAQQLDRQAPTERKNRITPAVLPDGRTEQA